MYRTECIIMKIVIVLNKGNLLQFDYIFELLKTLKKEHSIHLAIVPFSSKLIKNQFFKFIHLMGIYNLLVIQFRMLLNSFLFKRGVNKFCGKYTSLEAVTLAEPNNFP